MSPHKKLLTQHKVEKKLERDYKIRKGVNVKGKFVKRKN